MFLIRRITFFLSLLTSILLSQNQTELETTPPAVLMESQNKTDNFTSIPEQALNITSASAAINSSTTETSMSNLSTAEGTTARINVTVSTPSSGNNSEIDTINKTSLGEQSEQQAVKGVTAVTKNENVTSNLSPEAVIEQSTSLSTSEAPSNNSFLLSGEIGLRSIFYDEIVTAFPISAQHRNFVPYIEVGLNFEYFGLQWYLRDRFSLPTIRGDDNLYGVLTAGLTYRFE